MPPESQPKCGCEWFHHRSRDLLSEYDPVIESTLAGISTFLHIMDGMIDRQTDHIKSLG